MQCAPYRLADRLLVPSNGVMRRHRQLIPTLVILAGAGVLLAGVYREVPAWLGLGGMVLLFAGGLWALRRSRRRRTGAPSTAPRPRSATSRPGTTTGAPTTAASSTAVAATAAATAGTDQAASVSAAMTRERKRDPLAHRLDEAPLDDEPLADEDRAALREAREDVAAGRVISMEDLRRELETTDAGRSDRWDGR